MRDTRIGGAHSQFPATQWSAIRAAGSTDVQERNHGFEVIVEAYWKPVYKTIRIKWHKSNEDAKDLTQAFFSLCLEKNYFKDFDPTKARFRTYLRTCLNGFLANENKAALRIKRGGDRTILPLDFELADKELQSIERDDSRSAEDYFNKEWVRHLFAMGVSSLKNELEQKNKSVYFLLFEKYDLSEDDRMTYDELAAMFDLPVTKVTNYLAFARREFRALLLQKLREITISDEEFRDEARSLFGLDLG